MGSSLTVDRETPSKIAKRGSVCIINLQPTPIDNIATGPEQDGKPLRISGLVDDVMGRLAAALDFKIPEWNLTRYAKITWRPRDQQKADSPNAFTLNGLAPDLDTPYTLWKSVRCLHGTRVQESSSATASTNYEFTVPTGKTPELILASYGHYKEPLMKLPVEPGQDSFLRMTLTNSAKPKWMVAAGSREEILNGKGTSLKTDNVTEAPKALIPWAVGDRVTMGELTGAITRIGNTKITITFTDWGNLDDKYPKSSRISTRMADTMLQRVKETDTANVNNPNTECKQTDQPSKEPSEKKIVEDEDIVET